MTKQATSKKATWILILHILLLFNSSCGVLAKLAAKEEFLSLPFILYYAGEIAVLFIYTIVWQQVLKHMQLTVAFANKSVGMVWTMLWGVLLFNETVTATMIIGAVIVVVGVYLVVTSDE